MTRAFAEQIRKLHLKFAIERGHEKTYCPSEVAGQLGTPNWKDQMQNVRKIADALVNEDIIEVPQNGTVLTENPSRANGPIRLRLKKV
ncbi:DUF3253 domain-containing protein [Allomuricauda sp. d1]|uniref:DUF3253 domain-containing protein n=1 Tax=Allomuricauda sp. d1 TaxID=3136725 RepID=UPI0031DD518C